MREYETTVIVQPEISDEVVLELSARLGQIVEKDGGIQLMVDDQGRRRLAYEIENFQKGRYLMVHFLDDGTVVSQLERALRLDDSVLRFLTVQVSEEVADVEARKAAAAEEVRLREQRAAERAAREAEEAAERAAREAAASESSDDEESDDDDASDSEASDDGESDR